MKLPRLLSSVTGVVLATALATTACVTINIYFPAAAAEKAAEKIVEDVLSNQPAAPPKQPAMPPEGEKEGQVPHVRPLAELVLDFLIPPAYAAAPNFDIDTPAIRQLQARMRARNSELSPFYASGAAGFGKDGLVAARDAGSVGLKDRARFQKLVNEENKDRNALYREIAKANGHPEWEGDVRGVFARQWVDKASKGWWVQDASGGWRQK